MRTVSCSMCRPSGRSATNRFNFSLFLPPRPQFPDLAQSQPRRLPLPGAKRLLVSADLEHLLATLDLVQRLQDLLSRVTAPRHFRVLLVGSEDCASAVSSTYSWHSVPVLGQSGLQGLRTWKVCSSRPPGESHKERVAERPGPATKLDPSLCALVTSQGADETGYAWGCCTVPKPN